MKMWKKNKTIELCERFENEGMAIALLDHELTAEEEDFWLKHIEECETCMALMADVLYTDTQMKALALSIDDDILEIEKDITDLFLLNKLKVDANLEEDLFDMEGELLLAKGTRITPAILDILYSRGIEMVRYRTPVTDNNVEIAEDIPETRDEEKTESETAKPQELPKVISSFEHEPESAFVSRDFQDGFFFAGETSREPRFERQDYMNLMGNASYRETIRQITRQKALVTLKESIDNLHKGIVTDLTPVRDVAQEVLDEFFASDAKTLGLLDMFLFSSKIYSHSFNTMIIFAAITKSLNFEKEDIRDASEAVLMHDIGRVIPINGDDEDTDIYKNHPMRGYRFLMKQGGFNEQMLTVVLNHHERYDGKGFPRGLTGDKLGMLDQVMIVANVYDQAVTDPVHNVKRDFHKAAQLVYQSPNILVAPEIINAFLNVLGIYPPGSYVKLKSGEEGIVREANFMRPFQPKITLLKDTEGKNLPEPLEIDLRELEHNSIEKALDVAVLLENQ